MEQFAFGVGVLAVGFLGLSAGALLAEASVLVPFWRSEDPESFLSWYKQHAGLLLRFFGPLEVASSLLVVAATILAWLAPIPGKTLFAASTGLTIAVLASFPLYFKSANARFAAGSIPAADVSDELKRWARWHWARTGVAVAAFLLAALALAYRAPAEMGNGTTSALNLTRNDSTVRSFESIRASQAVDNASQLTAG